MAPFSSVHVDFLERQATHKVGHDQGCQMVCFQTKNTNLGQFWRVLQWKMLVYFMAIWYILWPFWYSLWLFGIFFPVLVCCINKNLATLVMTV
jgi:hypothetical protein